MKITDIRIFPVDEPKLKAFVSIIFDHCFIISASPFQRLAEVIPHSIFVEAHIRSRP